jgi:hypothetical protein
VIGVPLRDLDEAEFEALPAHLQASVDASDLYQKSNPKPEPRKAARADEPDKEE